MHRTESYSNELGSILNQRTLARRTQDIVPAIFFSAVEFIPTHDMAYWQGSPHAFQIRAGKWKAGSTGEGSRKGCTSSDPSIPPLLVPTITGRQH